MSGGASAPENRSSGERPPHSAFRESAEVSHLEIVLSRILREQGEQTSALLLRNQKALVAGMKDAIREGISEAAANEELVTKFFSTAFGTMRTQSKKAAGDFVWEKATTWSRRAGWAGVFVFAFWWYFGFAALKHLGVEVWHVLMNAQH